MISYLMKEVTSSVNATGLSDCLPIDKSMNEPGSIKKKKKAVKIA